MSASVGLEYGQIRAKERDVVLRVTIPGEPLSKQRPRWERKSGRVYTPDETRHREASIRVLVKPHMRELAADGMALFSLRAGFYLGSGQRRDVDNMLKLISDALTGVVWEDDSQVVEVFGFKVPADGTPPRAEVLVTRMPGMMPYTFARCAVCQREFRTYPSWKFRTYCSRRCMALGTRHRIATLCARCHAPMELKAHQLKARRQFCSRACRHAASRETRACVQCGASFEIAQSYHKQTCSRACATRRGRAKRGVQITVEAL